MSHTLSWSLTVSVSSGPGYSLAQSLVVDAIDIVHASLAEAEQATALVQPGDAANVDVLLLVSSAYGADLTYSLDADLGDNATWRKLEAPLFLLGADAVAMVGDTHKQFTFKNNLANPVGVNIMVGRRI